GDQEPIGSLAQAASAAREAAEARIKAALTEYRNRSGDGHPYPDYDDEADAPPPPRQPAAQSGPARPEIYATDALDPPPRPEAASGAFSPPPAGQDKPGHDQPGHDQPDHDKPGQDQAERDTDHDRYSDHDEDAEFAAGDQSAGSTASFTRRNRLSR